MTPLVEHCPWSAIVAYDSYVLAALVTLITFSGTQITFFSWIAKKMCFRGRPNDCLMTVYLREACWKSAGRIIIVVVFSEYPEPFQ